jgi:hypothetical protein
VEHPLFAPPSTIYPMLRAYSIPPPAPAAPIGQAQQGAMR